MTQRMLNNIIKLNKTKSEYIFVFLSVTHILIDIYISTGEPNRFSASNYPSTMYHIPFNKNEMGRDTQCRGDHSLQKSKNNDDKKFQSGHVFYHWWYTYVSGYTSCSLVFCLKCCYCASQQGDIWVKIDLHVMDLHMFFDKEELSRQSFIFKNKRRP